MNAVPDDAHFHLFVYGALRLGASAERVLAGAQRIGAATVAGSIYDIDGRFPALMLYGDGVVHGEVWRCAVPMLRRLDGYESVAGGKYRRVALRVGERPCWTYVAGPGLASKIRPDARIASGDWLDRDD